MVVTVGTTNIEPEEGTAPILGVIVVVLAPVTAQVNVVLSPSVIKSGLTEKVFIAGGLVDMPVFVLPVVFTVTITDLVTEL